MTLGPNGSYWSWSKTHGTSYHNVPQRLLEKVKEYDGTAPRVTLGADDSFIYWDEEGQWFCSLYDYPGAYERLVKQMDKHENVKIVVGESSMNRVDMLPDLIISRRLRFQPLTASPISYFFQTGLLCIKWLKRTSQRWTALLKHLEIT